MLCFVLINSVLLSLSCVWIKSWLKKNRRLKFAKNMAVDTAILCLGVSVCDVMTKARMCDDSPL